MSKKPESMPACVSLSKLSVVFLQESDYCDDDETGQELQIDTADAGGGNYFVLSTKRWAFDGPEDLTCLLDTVKRTADALKALEAKK